MDFGHPFCQDFCQFCQRFRFCLTFAKLNITGKEKEKDIHKVGARKYGMYRKLEWQWL
jgi:hypothetical protein